VTAHGVIRQEVPADATTAFDLVHDYTRRLDWDTLLRRAYTVGGAPPDVGVEAVCTARRRLGGFSFRTRYVTFRRPELAAVTLVGQPPFFAKWAASIRHRPLEQSGDGSPRSELVYTLTFTCRPTWLAWLIEPIALAAFRLETRRRLRALAAHLARTRA
jgi:hypothetical protein